MATTLGFKDLIDLPEWRPVANALIVNNPDSTQFVFDPRNSEDRIPYLYRVNSQQQIDAYSMKNDGWIKAIGGNPAFGALTNGVGAVFAPSQGPRGTLAAGASTTKIILSTALPAAVGTNQLANRGDGTGYKVRIVDNAAGASGKIEERYVVSNTSGTTPTIYLDSALSFTPTTGSTYEFLSGKIYCLTGASPTFRSYDVLTNSFASLATSGTINFASATAIAGLSLDELQVPLDRAPKEGFLNTLVATATAAGTLTGTVGGGDSAILANEYRNFQIRIVQDTATPTAVGQRRKISSHTAGASPVYTLASNWTVTPSATCSFVIELDNDKIMWWANTGTVMMNYNITANTWDQVTWAARTAGTVMWAAPSWGLSASNLGTGKEARHSYIYFPNTNGDGNINLFDMAGAATGAYTANVAFGGSFGSTVTWSASMDGVMDMCTNQGRFCYLQMTSNTGAVGQTYYRFDVRNRVLEPWSFRPFPENTTVLGVNAKCMALALYIDGATKLNFLTVLRRSNATQTLTGLATETFQIALQR